MFQRQDQEAFDNRSVGGVEPGLRDEAFACFDVPPGHAQQVHDFQPGSPGLWLRRAHLVFILCCILHVRRRPVYGLHLKGTGAV